MATHSLSRTLRWKLCFSALFTLAMAIGWSCSDKSSSTGSDGDGDGGPNDLSGGASASIVDSAGGSLTTAGGITLTIDPGIEVPRGTSAMVRTMGLLGDKYVELVPPLVHGVPPNGPVVTGPDPK